MWCVSYVYICFVKRVLKSPSRKTLGKALLFHWENWLRVTPTIENTKINRSWPLQDGEFKLRQLQETKTCILLPRAKSCFCQYLCSLPSRWSFPSAGEDVVTWCTNGFVFIFIVDFNENLFHCNAFASWLQCFWYRQGLTRNKRILI